MMKKKARKNNICVVITAYNEEKNIADCIKSAQMLTKNIIVVDTESTDKTAVIAGKLGATVFKFSRHPYVEPSRDFAVSKAEGDWVLILDPDERVSAKIAKEIKTIISKTTITHFKIPRKNIFAQKKWLEHGGWSPDDVIRLIKKPAFVNWPSAIHSTPMINGEAGHLKNPLIHYFHSNIESMVAKTTVFEDIDSNLLYKAKKPANTIIFFRKYLGELWRRLFKSFGFMDGSYGIIESLYQAYSKTITYLMLYEKNKISGRL